MIEIVGLIATCVIVCSFLFKNENKIRIINMVGSSVWLGYGLYLGLPSIIFANVLMISIHLFMLRGSFRWT